MEGDKLIGTLMLWGAVAAVVILLLAVVGRLRRRPRSATTEGAGLLGSRPQRLRAQRIKATRADAPTSGPRFPGASAPLTVSSDRAHTDPFGLARTEKHMAETRHGAGTAAPAGSGNTTPPATVIVADASSIADGGRGKRAAESSRSTQQSAIDLSDGPGHGSAETSPSVGDAAPPFLRERTLPGDWLRGEPGPDPLASRDPPAAEAFSVADPLRTGSRSNVTALEQPLEQRIDTEAWVRARVRRSNGEREFLTLHILATGMAGRTRILLVDAGGIGRTESIAADQVDHAVDLMTSERVDDVWTWLTSGALPPSVIVMPSPGAQARSA